VSLAVIRYLFFFWLLPVVLEHHGLCASSSYLIFIMRTTHFLCLFLIFFLFVFIRVGLRFYVRDGMGLSFTISFFFGIGISIIY
jgi:hypothetical protein